MTNLKTTIAGLAALLMSSAAFAAVDPLSWQDYYETPSPRPNAPLLDLRRGCQ
jgi:hypothetical protein